MIFHKCFFLYNHDVYGNSCDLMMKNIINFLYFLNSSFKINIIFERGANNTFVFFKYHMSIAFKFDLINSYK